MITIRAYKIDTLEKRAKQIKDQEIPGTDLTGKGKRNLKESAGNKKIYRRMQQTPSDPTIH